MRERVDVEAESEGGGGSGGSEADPVVEGSDRRRVGGKEVDAEAADGVVRVEAEAAVDDGGGVGWIGEVEGWGRDPEVAEAAGENGGLGAEVG